MGFREGRLGPSRKTEAKNWGESKPPVLTPIAFTDFLKKLSLGACKAQRPERAGAVQGQKRALQGGRKLGGKWPVRDRTGERNGTEGQGRVLNKGMI